MDIQYTTIIWSECALMKASVNWVQLSSLNLDALTREMRFDLLETPQFYQEFGKMLRKMTALTELSMKQLSGCSAVLRVVVPALPPQLEVLDLSDNYLPRYPLCKVLSRMTNLRELDMSLCKLSNEQIVLLTPCLANCPALTSLRMNGLLAGSGPVSALVKGLTQLQLLHLEHCYMEDRHVAELVRSLYHHHHLTSLNLSGNILANETGRALAKWPQLLCLEELGLGKLDTSAYADISVVEEALQQSLCFRRIVPSLKEGLVLQQATRDVCHRNTIRHTTLLSISYDPNRVMGSMLVCKK